MPKKNTTSHKEWHTSKSKIGMGDYYGTAIPNKMATSIDIMGVKMKGKSSTKKAPKSLA